MKGQYPQEKIVAIPKEAAQMGNATEVSRLKEVLGKNGSAFAKNAPQ